MKIAVTAVGREISSDLDLRFGRAKYFVVYNTDDKTFSAHDNNQNLNAAQGAGIQAAESVLRLGVDVIISGNVGPKAFRVLNAGEVKIYLCEKTTVEDAVHRFEAGELKEADAANVAGHWM